MLKWPLWIVAGCEQQLCGAVDDVSEYWIVDWMQRLVDPSLLRDDLFADYFASQAPPGYVAIFRVLLLATDPLTASKVLPPEPYGLISMYQRRSS